MVRKAPVRRRPAEELAEALEVITAAVPGLRAAGATRCCVGDVEIFIEAAQPEPQPRRATPADDDFLDTSRPFRPGRRINIDPGDDGINPAALPPMD